MEKEFRNGYVFGTVTMALIIVLTSILMPWSEAMFVALGAASGNIFYVMVLSRPKQKLEEVIEQ